jgi:hypothetical protein
MRNETSCSMNEPGVIYDRYLAAFRSYGDLCARASEHWHRPDVVEFSQLYNLLLPHAERGDMLCQYAVPTILWQGLLCETEKQFIARDLPSRKEATCWWIAAARQGHLPALDNLVTSGIGLEAERAREGWKQLAEERPDLVGSSNAEPIYGDEFVQELCVKLYGRVVPNAEYQPCLKSF